MLDIRFVRENPEAVKENIRKKFQESKLVLVDEVLDLDVKLRAAKTLLELNESVLALHRLVVALDSGSRRGQKQRRLVVNTAPSRNISRVILGRGLGFICCLVLFINNHTPEIFNGRKDRRARSDHKVGISRAYSHK